MDMEQILKQVDWLDDERRKDQDVLASLEKRMTVYEGNLPELSRQIRELSGEITRLSTVIGRMDHYDEALLNQRVETKQFTEGLEKQFKKREGEIEKVRRVEIRGIDNNIAELRKELGTLPELTRSLRASAEEEARLGRTIHELRERIETVRHNEEEYTRSYRLLEDGRRQDAKRLTDIQGEVTALRKRTDNQRGQLEIMSASLRKVETHLKELATVESERREAQDAFLEKQALSQVERERVWKEWQVRFETVEKQAIDVEANMQTLDATRRDVKRSQQSVEELTQKVDRRINEMTEIQRLSEERFRQEWVTFKADDQKRWINYTLTHEEQRGETVRQYEKLSDRVTHIEDGTQEIQDLLQEMNELTEKRLQTLLSVTHEWVTAYERSSIGYPR